MLETRTGNSGIMQDSESRATDTGAHYKFSGLDIRPAGDWEDVNHGQKHNGNSIAIEKNLLRSFDNDSRASGLAGRSRSAVRE